VRSRQFDLKVMPVAAVDNALGSLEVSAEVGDQLWMTEKDVQAADAPRSCRREGALLNVVRKEAPSTRRRHRPPRSVKGVSPLYRVGENWGGSDREHRLVLDTEQLVARTQWRRVR
jgi:hypothetical protein